MVARLEAYRWAAGVWDPRFTADLERELPRLRAVAERGGAAGRSLLLMLAFRSAFEGRHHDEILALVERGLDQGRLIESESGEAIEITWAARALTFIDELDRADRLLDELAADSRKRGSVMGYATASAWRAAVALRRGEIAAAEADARSAVELATTHGLHFILPHSYSFLGEALIELGELNEAALLLKRAELGPMRGSRPEGRFLHTVARVSLVRGDRDAAIAALRACEGQEPWFKNPNAMTWRSTLALALPASSRAEALALVDLELKQARKVGLPRAIGVALRARGLLCKGEEQISLLTQAVAALEACPSRLEQAHALTDLGAAHRRAGGRSEARQLLARALDLAAACGARALASSAREELVIAGARPRRERLSGVEALTASERRVAEMAAAGMTNREIAQALFVTMKAVALHLTHVYEKLDVAGRAQLPGTLGETDSATQGP
jgi:ATP/maltotriose-dependent transcriptional regulator MalT